MRTGLLLVLSFHVIGNLCFADDTSSKIEQSYFEGAWSTADSLVNLIEKGTPFSSLRTNASYLKVKGIRHYYHFEVQSAEQSLQSAIVQAEKSGNFLVQSEANEWLGHICMRRNEPDRAIQFYTAALELRKANGLAGGLSDFYLNYFLASANYVFGQREKEREDLPFIRSNWSHGSKPLKISGYDSLAFRFIKIAIEALSGATTQANYKPTLLFTRLVQLPVSPDQYESLLISLAPSVKEGITASPTLVTLTAQAAVWHLGYYKYLMDEFNMKVPVVHRQPESDFLKINTFTRKGRMDAGMVRQSITRLHSRSDLVGFYKCMAILQRVVPQVQPRDQSSLPSIRNQCAEVVGQISKTYRKTYLSLVEIINQQKEYEQRLQASNTPDKLNQVNVKLDQDRELYATYLLKNTYTLDSTAAVWFQKNLALFDRSLPMQLRENPTKVPPELNPNHRAALEAVLLKAAFEYELGYASMNEALAANFNLYPFNLGVNPSGLMMMDMREKFQRMAVKTWRVYEGLYDALLLQLPHAIDRYYWAGQSHVHRLIAMDVAFSYLPLTARTTNEIAEMEDVFFFSERTKATVFLSDLSTSIQTQSASLTPRDTQKKDSLLYWVTLLNVRARRGSTSATDSLVKVQQQLEKILPSKNDSRKALSMLPSLLDVQRSLDLNTAIVWWVTAPENLFRFVLTATQLKVTVKVRKEEKNLPLIKGMRNGIMFQQEEIYRESAQTLYKKLMPNLDDNIKNLILIPDREMNLVPFEVLLTGKVSKKEIGNWSLYPFLIKQYSISYQPSVLTYWLRQNQSPQGSMEFVGYAPIFSQATTSNSSSMRSLQLILDQIDPEGKAPRYIEADQVTPLPATQNEVESIRGTFEKSRLPVKVFLSQEANEQSIRTQKVSSSTIIHMATHGFANPHEPSECGVLMADIVYPSNDDGILFGYEIALMNLPAKLVTLSACETALGKVLVGEGSLSLTRNFLLAGTQNVLSSLWKVPDEETSKLMISFYSQFSQSSDTFAPALQRAKLDLINAGKGDPYYWSAFILTGK